MKRRFVGSIVAAGCVIAAVACFSERGAGPTVSGGVQCQVPVSVIDSGHVIVAIRNFTFVPDSVAVPAGGTVTWINCEDPQHEPHTTTADGGEWNSAEFSAGQRFSHTFPTSASGAFPYHCTPHPFMTGKVVVQ